MKHIIIPIAGFARAGKDTLANALFNHLDVTEPSFSAIILKFADSLKGCAQVAINEAGVDADVFTEDTKSKAALRPLLVAFGEYCRYKNPDVWVNKVVMHIEKWVDVTVADSSSTGSIVLVPDLRYANEYEKLEAMCQRRGWEFVPIYIERNGNLPANDAEAESIGLMAARGYFSKGNALSVAFPEGRTDQIGKWAEKFTRSISVYK